MTTTTTATTTTTTDTTIMMAWGVCHPAPPCTQPGRGGQGVCEMCGTRTDRIIRMRDPGYRCGDMHGCAARRADARCVAANMRLHAAYAAWDAHATAEREAGNGFSHAEGPNALAAECRAAWEGVDDAAYLLAAERFGRSADEEWNARNAIAAAETDLRVAQVVLEGAREEYEAARAARDLRMAAG